MRWLAFSLCLVPQVAWAQLEFAGDAPRIYTIEPRLHLYKNELQIGVGVLPNDAFYVGLPVAASYTYHFNELWAWEVANAFYSTDFDTSLTSELRDAGASAVNASRRIRFLVGSNVILKPLYGKLAVFNSGVSQLETRFTTGLGVMVSNQDTSLALNVGAGLHFWATQTLAARFDIRDYFVFTPAGVDNVLLILLSGSLNFTMQVAQEGTPPG